MNQLDNNFKIIEDFNLKTYEDKNALSRNSSKNKLDSISLQVSSAEDLKTI